MAAAPSLPCRSLGEAAISLGMSARLAPTVLSFSPTDALVAGSIWSRARTDHVNRSCHERREKRRTRESSVDSKYLSCASIERFPSRPNIHFLQEEPVPACNGRAALLHAVRDARFVAVDELNTDRRRRRHTAAGRRPRCHTAALGRGTARSKNSRTASKNSRTAKQELADRIAL